MGNWSLRAHLRGGTRYRQCADNLINDVSHVQEKFPGIPDHLAERLGMSLLIRRQYFRDREESFNRQVVGADHTQGASLSRSTKDWVFFFFFLDLGSPETREGLPKSTTTEMAYRQSSQLSYECPQFQKNILKGRSSARSAIRWCLPAIVRAGSTADSRSLLQYCTNANMENV